MSSSDMNFAFNTDLSISELCSTPDQHRQRRSRSVASFKRRKQAQYRRLSHSSIRPNYYPSVSYLPRQPKSNTKAYSIKTHPISSRKRQTQVRRSSRIQGTNLALHHITSHHTTSHHTTSHFHLESTGSRYMQRRMAFKTKQRKIEARTATNDSMRMQDIDTSFSFNQRQTGS